MLHEKPVKYGPLGDDVDETNMAWTGEKRRRKYLPQSSSSDAPIATAQDPIPRAFLGGDEAAKCHQGLVSDMAIVQEQDHALSPRTDSGEEESGPLVDLTEEDQANDAKKLAPDVPHESMTPSMSLPEKLKVLAQHALHRIAYYKIVKADSIDKLKGSGQYTDDELRKHEYFKYLESDGDFEWFFHPDDISNPDLDDYQRIDLTNILRGSSIPEYRNVCEYHDFHHTYEMDAVYVKYYGEISKKIKWIEEFLHLDVKSVEEYIAELRDDVALKGLDLVYFEIWRQVVKENKEYEKAVELVHGMNEFSMHKRTIEAELTGAPVFWTMRQRIYGIILENDIVANTEDDKARDFFRKGVAGLKKKNMVKYAQKKMEIAKQLNLHKRIEVPRQIEVPGHIEVP